MARILFIDPRTGLLTSFNPRKKGDEWAKNPDKVKEESFKALKDLKKKKRY